jgi:hypothetical protein
MDLVSLVLLILLWIVHWISYPQLLAIFKQNYPVLLIILGMVIHLGFLMHLAIEKSPICLWRPHRVLVGPWALIGAILALISALGVGMLLFSWQVVEPLKAVVNYLAGFIVLLGIFTLGMAFYLVAWCALIDGIIYDPKWEKAYRRLDEDDLNALFYWVLVVNHGLMGSALLTSVFVIACDAVKRSPS